MGPGDHGLPEGPEEEAAELQAGWVGKRADPYPPVPTQVLDAYGCICTHLLGTTPDLSGGEE